MRSPDDSSDTEDAWQAVKRDLEGRLYEISRQIRTYPAPIPACDAQFNPLMEQRRLLTRERARLLAVRGNGQVSVEEFLRRSPLTHDGVTAGR